MGTLIFYEIQLTIVSVFGNKRSACRIINWSNNKSTFQLNTCPSFIAHRRWRPKSYRWTSCICPFVKQSSSNHQNQWNKGSKNGADSQNYKGFPITPNLKASQFIHGWSSHTPFCQLLQGLIIVKHSSDLHIEYICPKGSRRLSTIE